MSDSAKEIDNWDCKVCAWLFGPAFKNKDEKMSQTFTFTTAIERGDYELEYEIIYSATPRIDATYWQPAEGGEIEIVGMRYLGGGCPEPLTDAEIYALFPVIEARFDSDWLAHQADEADHRYEMMRDDRMMEKWDD